MKLAIIDFNRTIYDPETSGLIEGAESLLQALSSRMPLVLVSKQEAGRDDIVDSLGIKHYFSEVIFTATKSPELFLEVIRRHGAEPHTTGVVGDYIREEISHGNSIGARTVRLKRGKFADYIPKRPEEEAWRTVEHLSEVDELLR